MPSIWNKLKLAGRPFFVLAPMDDVTDTVFREVVVRAAAPDMAVTEFASVDGFAHPAGRASVERRLQVNDSEAALGVPLIAQIWGTNPDHYYNLARDLAARKLFSGIDINMGCPEKSIVQRGCCGGLIKAENWETAAAIIQATKDGAGHLPVSVKTRIGVNRVITEEWAAHLLDQDIAAMAIHARTVRELSRVPARWDEIAKVVQLRDQLAPQTVIIGNGDVAGRAHGEQLAADYGVDGVMIGRGVLHDLFAFNPDQPNHPPEELFRILLQHLTLYEQTWGSAKSYEPLKKFFKLYISGFAGAAELRARLMETKTPDAARMIVREITEKALAPV